MHFRHISRSHGVQSSGFSMHVLAVGRSLEPADLGPIEWVPGSITLKGVHFLTQPHISLSANSFQPYVSSCCGSRCVQSMLHHRP